jgi:hypothetical protein
MGQYYKPVCIEEGEYFYSHTYGSGLKLMEHSWVDNEMVNAVVNHIANGDWKGKRIVWAGDYMDAGLFLPNQDARTETGDVHTLYSYATQYFTPVSKEFADTAYYPELRYIVNLIKKQYVDLNKLPECSFGESWRVHPLPLLTCSGNGRGLGDYRDESTIELQRQINELDNQYYKESSETKKEKINAKIMDLQKQIETANPYVGAWAGDRIIVVKEAPEGFEEITPNFKE